MKKIYSKSKILSFLSFLPFLLWLSIGFTGNVEIAGIEYFICFIGFLALSLFTPVDNKLAKVISLVCLLIISSLLAIEGTSNEMFGPLYPYFILIFCGYYIILNIISIRRK